MPRMMQSMNWRIYIIYSFTSLLILLLASCSSMGPNSVRAGRLQYNKALGQSAAEQMLLNIVKMRFLDRPVFLSVSSMTSNLSFQTELSTSTPDIFKSTAFTTTVNPSLTWKDNPTISYEELTGVEYVTQMLSPIPADTIVLLLQSWPADMVLPLAVNEINNINNNWNPIDSNLNSDAEEEHKKFAALTKVIDALGSQRTLEWSVSRSSDSDGTTTETAILLNRPKDSKTENLTNSLLSSLGLSRAEKGPTIFTVEYGLQPKDESTIVFGTRSVQDIMSFASMNVDIPEELSKAALARDPDWKDRDGYRLLHIRSSHSEPRNNIAVAIPYHGYWFYIEDDDLQSKATFLLMQVLMGMQSGASGSGAPILTIPVSG